MMKKFVSMLVVFVLCAFLLCSCGGDDASSGDGVINPDIVNDGQTSEITGDTGNLTDTFAGDWEVKEVYQEARVSDRFSDEGLALERTQAVHMGTDFYESYGYHYDQPYYTVETVSSSVLADYGFSGDNIEKDFGDTVEMISVYDTAPGQTNIVYFAKGANLIKFGAGAHLYLCERVEAVG